MAPKRSGRTLANDKAMAGSSKRKHVMPEKQNTNTIDAHDDSEHCTKKAKTTRKSKPKTMNENAPAPRVQNVQTPCSTRRSHATTRTPPTSASKKTGSNTSPSSDEARITTPPSRKRTQEPTPPSTGSEKRPVRLRLICNPPPKSLSRTDSDNIEISSSDSTITDLTYINEPAQSSPPKLSLRSDVANADVAAALTLITPVTTDNSARPSKASTIVTDASATNSPDQSPTSSPRFVEPAKPGEKVANTAHASKRSQSFIIPFTGDADSNTAYSKILRYEDQPPCCMTPIPHPKDNTTDGPAYGSYWTLPLPKAPWPYPGKKQAISPQQAAKLRQLELRDRRLYKGKQSNPRRVAAPSIPKDTPVISVLDIEDGRKPRARRHIVGDVGDQSNVIDKPRERKRTQKAEESRTTSGRR